MAKCNLAPELREEYLKRKELWAHSTDELEQCRRFFENYLFCDRGEIRQIHGYRNEGYPHAVRPEVKYGAWLQQWQEWYRNGSPRDKNGRAIIKEKRISA